MLTTALALLALATSDGASPAALPAPARAALDARLAAAGRATAVWDDDGGVAAAGLDWKATFDSAGVTFTPALGASVPVNLTLGLELVGASVGGDPLAIEAPAGGPRPSGAAVTLDRGSLVETFAARERGLELYVTVDSLPRRGELVLRYALGGDLALSAAGAERAEFTLPGTGGVAIDGVVGIDARGRTAAGSLRAVPGAIEFVLPADFVATAELPLVVDPLVSTKQSIDFLQDCVGTDLAWESTSGRYLAVWELEFSESDRDIYGWMRDENGASVGGLLALATTTANEIEPAVGANPNTGEFVVVWSREVAPGDHDIYGREVTAATGFAGTTNAILTGPADARDADLSNEAAGLGNDFSVVLAWHEDGERVMVCQLMHPFSGGLWVTGVGLVASSGSRPSISDNGGAAGRHLLVWQDVATGFGGTTTDILTGVVVNRSAAVVYSSAFLEYNSAGVSEPVAAGNGDEFWAAYLQAPSGSDRNVRVRRLTWTGVGLDHFEYDVTASTDSGLLYDPQITTAGDQLLVTWERQSFLFTALEYAALDAATLALCEPQTAVPSEVLAQFDAAVASRGDRALIAWSEFDVVSLDSDVVLQPFSPTTTAASKLELGGGTASGGRCSVPCAFVGNGNFAFELDDVGLATTSYLVLGTVPLGQSCGGGLLHVDPFSSFVIATGSFFGSTSFVAPVAIPDDPAVQGLTMTAQWLTPVLGGGACALFGAELSTAIRFTVE